MIVPKSDCCARCHPEMGVQWRKQCLSNGPRVTGFCINTQPSERDQWWQLINFCPYCACELPNQRCASGLLRILQQYKIRFDTEAHTQSDIEQVLKACDIQHKREYQLPGGPIDFLTVQGVGIECKVGGSPAEVLRQLLRYAEQEPVKEMLLVTSKSGHRWRSDLQLMNKPFEILWIGASSL